MKYTLIIIACLISRAPASTCRVITQDRHGGISNGTGSLTDLATPQGNRVIFTAAHNLNLRRNNVAILKFNDLRVYGKVLYEDADSDVAFIAATPKYLSSLPATRLSDKTPAPGERITVEGYGSGFRLVRRAGHVTRLDEYTNGGVPLLTTTARVVQGDSGGPVRDSQGQQVSIITGGGQFQIGARTDVILRAAHKCNLQRMYCDESGRCYMRPAQTQVQSPVPQRRVSPQHVPAIPYVPFHGEPYTQGNKQPATPVQKHQIEIIVKQERAQPIPITAEPVKPEIDYRQISSAIQSAVPKTVQLDFNSQELVDAIVSALKESQTVPEAIHLEIYDRQSGDIYHQETHRLRGVTGVIKIRVPYDRSGIGNTGSFRVDVQ